MPVQTIQQKMLWGYTTYPNGAIALNGRDYLTQEILSTPAVEHRAKPLDVDQFSLTNTPRTYFFRTRSMSDMGSRVDYFKNIITIPVAWNGGTGNFGLSTPAYVPDIELASKVKNQKANLGVTLAKYRELCILFSAFGGQVLKSAAEIQRLDRRRRRALLLNKATSFHPLARAAFKGASALYLGYMFGLRQFVADFKAVSDALRRRFDDPIYQHVYFRKHLWDEVVKTGSAGSNEEWRATVTSVDDWKVRARFRVFPNEQVLAQMGATNPIAVAYDYIPFSFVLNWMIPIGKYLAALDALEGIADFRWYHTRSQAYQCRTSYPKYGKAESQYYWESVIRSGVTQRLQPPLPSFEPSRFASNVLTGVALLGALNKNPSVANAMVRVR
jgi:hypothetical protein